MLNLNGDVSALARAPLARAVSNGGGTGHTWLLWDSALHAYSVSV